MARANIRTPAEPGVKWEFNFPPGKFHVQVKPEVTVFRVRRSFKASHHWHDDYHKFPAVLPSRRRVRREQMNNRGTRIGFRHAGRRNFNLPVASELLGYLFNLASSFNWHWPGQVESAGPPGPSRPLFVTSPTTSVWPLSVTSTSVLEKKKRHIFGSESYVRLEAVAA
jgi:hypothetical protein